MIDSEDINILDEIRALENALTSKETRQVFSDSIRDDTTPESLEVVKSRHREDNVGTTAYDLNERLMNSIKLARQEVVAILEDCEEKLRSIDQKIERYSNAPSTVRTVISSAGMPYFKDKDHFAAPKNYDEKLKSSNGELQIINLGKCCRWTPRDRDCLLKAIHQEAIEKLLQEYSKSDPSKETTSRSKAKEKQFIPKNFKEIIDSLGEREFDWLKISVTDFNGKHLEDECRTMWNVFLHPDINKCKWYEKEDVRLRIIVKARNYQNWDSVARELSTKRSGYQCFIRYNTIKNNSKLSTHTWKAYEDKKLSSLVDKLRIGDFIPWGEVASCMQNLTKQQVYFRWTYSLVPHLKKGRFTKKESEILLEGVNQFGENFSKISTYLMPHRSSIQLNDHYKTLLSRRDENFKVWSVSDDLKLLQLHVKMGSDWSRITKHFKHKNRIQLRHRHGALTRYMAAGIPISKIPRRKKNKNHVKQNARNANVESEAKELEADCDDKIDQLLEEHFQYLYTSTSYHFKQKGYSPVELADATKELYNILQVLNANLHIPDNFDYFPLMNERDKQVLFSLKNYIRSKKEVDEDAIENLRIKMFGPGTDTEQSRFIPPPPFCAHIKVKKLIKTKSIDYSLDASKTLLVDVTMEFDTPDLVILFIGGFDEHLKFQKISKLLQFNEMQASVRHEQKSREEVTQKQHTIQKTLSTNKICANKDTSQKTLPSNSLYDSTIFITQNDRKEEENEEEEEVAIEPNYTTLLGFRNLNALKIIGTIENNFKIPLSYKGIKKDSELGKAYNLLKNRLKQLFKFPIVMSQTLLPEVHGVDSVFLCESEQSESLKRQIDKDIKLTSKRIRFNDSDKVIPDNDKIVEVREKSIDRK